MYIFVALRLWTIMLLNRLNILLYIIPLVAILVSADCFAQNTRRERVRPNVVTNDSVKNNVEKTDSIRVGTAKTDTIQSKEKKKSMLEAPVTYESKDSILFLSSGFAKLYGDGKVRYQNIELDAEIISMNLDSATVHAYGVTDSLGNIKGKPVFKEGDTAYDTKMISYNFKSRKAGIRDIITKQDEGYLVGKVAKKDSDDNICLHGFSYTTCDHHDCPHFRIRGSKAKIVDKRKVVSGPVYLEVADVPLPLFLPFFFFPNNNSTTSGFHMPTHMDDSSRGYGLTDGGYYFAINDYFDFTIKGDIFTRGSWRLSGLTNYMKRYKFSGSLQTDYQVTVVGDKGQPDYSVAKDFKIIWNHRQDPKSSPNSNFSASVNFSTSSYERSNVGNLYNSQLLTQNTKTSSINYSRNFPSIGLSIHSTANIAQTMRDSSIAITLPDLNISLSRFYPLKRKKAVGSERWYEKISMSYSGRLTNSLRTKDNLLFKAGLSQWQNAMNHNIPINATFTAFKYFQITPSFNYTERWYTKKLKPAFDERGNIITDTERGAEIENGFYRVYNYSGSISMNTKLYGMYKPLFMRKKEIQIRHVITPNISFSSSPGFKQYWYEYENNAGDLRYYSPYQGQPYGVPNKDGSGTVHMSLSNNIEMKYRNSNDSIVKQSIIDELSASMSYNLAAKERPWSDLNMGLRLRITPKYTFSINATFATYAYEFDKNGNVRIGNRTEWSYGRFGRFQGYGSSFSYTLDNNTWKKWFGEKDEDKPKKDEKKEQTNPEAGGEDNILAEGNDENKKVVKNAEADREGYQVFKMPWSVNFSYSYNIREDTSKPINRHSMRYPYKYTHNLSVNGNIKISNNWAMSFNTGYDFQAKEITQTSCSVTRDLHCFTLTANLSPFGRWKYYNITIGAKASILQDLKYESRSETRSNIQWY